MNKKLFYSVFSALLLFAAMFFTACSDELATNNETVNSVEDFSGLVCFSAELSDETRTSITPAGAFKWTANDKIYVYKENKEKEGKWIPSSQTVLSDDGATAKFYFGADAGKFDAETYPVVFSNSAGATSAIPSEQIQSTGNNSEHLGVAGDCGVATATKDGNGKYSFALEHQMSYLMFEPKVTNAGDEFFVSRIKITEVSSPAKNISGSFVFSLDAGNKPVIAEAATGGSNEITVICGKDVKPVENGTMDISKAEDYGFSFTNTDYSIYDGSNNSRIYMVIKPGEYKLKIEYEVSSTTQFEEVSFHESISGSSVQWHPTPRGYTEIQKREMSVSQNFEANKYYKFRHKLKVPVPDESNIYRYNFDQYYMWGASKWFWDGVSTYPVAADGSQAENQPTPTPDKASRADSRWYGSATYADYYPGGLTGNANGKHAQADMGFWANGGVLTANQMSYYVVYGDPHYDNTKPWILNSYVGKKGVAPLICYGGVWFKKKAKITSDIQKTNPSFTWPNHTSEGNSLGKYSAPLQTHMLPVGHSDLGREFNLRFNAPASNYRTIYTNKAAHDADPEGKWLRPWQLDSSKDSLDYFFVPCLGRIEYDHAPDGSQLDPMGTGDPTLTLVGGQGYYWTRTPVRGNEGQTQWYVNGTNGYDNAFYLQLHYEYVALSWQMRSIYVKTGMVPARTSGGAGVVVFQ